MKLPPGVTRTRACFLPVPLSDAISIPIWQTSITFLLLVITNVWSPGSMETAFSTTSSYR